MAMKTNIYLLFTLLVLGLYHTSPACAEGGWGPFGIRGGFAADEAKDRNTTQYEVFGEYQLPWSLRSKKGWGISTQVALTAGAMKSQGDYGFVGSLGPSFAIGNPDRFPLELDLGVSVGLLSRERFGSRDYNGMEQFISHGGVIYHINRHLGLSYRFQHMSNAGFNGSPNPGLNMHLFGINWYPSR